MVTITDFIILNKKLEKYYKLLCDITGYDDSKLMSPVKMKRFGFYFYILENVCDMESNNDDIIDAIIDTEFNKEFFNDIINDFGMDAVYINEDKKCVKLFNFKYRESFNNDKTQSLNDSFISTKFLNLCLCTDKKEFDKYPEKLKCKLKKLNDIFLTPKDVWDVTLYQVSNEAKEVKTVNSELENLASVYQINIKPLALPTISQFMSIRPKDINASMILSKDALMCYSEDSKATAKSYVLRVRCDEIIRITSNDEQLRLDKNIEDISVLANSILEYGVLFDNVRGFVKNSKYNPNISDTIKNNPTKFFMYNNGITIVANSIAATNLAGNRTMRLDINGFQIVNGGQTLRTIHEFNKENSDNISNYLCNAEVLLRVFMPDIDSNDIHKIAEYTNSQNSIKPSDLKSLSTEQINIERYLDVHDIAYIRKSGDTGSDEGKKYKFIIKMETFGQILKAVSGYPEKSTNSMKDIFEKDYNNLFIHNFDIKRAPELITYYYDVIKAYKESSFNGNQIKYFYILYIKCRRVNDSYSHLINKLESCISEYEMEDISTVRKMGLLKFKEFVNNKFNI
ncbi:AIPR family protein [Xenorhabdus sp. TS4]|uniref:AIPR family protein n=1 Tax=Xenorhabdus sp. TS4 TaxID=1873483 RepID=UPI00165695DE|nr:AIPR family protein [Xenorhabdus sp. TS4]MBC8951205.1 abortive infection protein [Xenorhabdus sp. TS4]